MDQQEIDQNIFNIEAEQEILKYCCRMVLLCIRFCKILINFDRSIRMRNYNRPILYFLLMTCLFYAAHVSGIVSAFLAVIGIFVLFVVLVVFRIVYLVVKSRTWFLYNAYEKYFHNRDINYYIWLCYLSIKINNFYTMDESVMQVIIQCEQEDNEVDRRVETYLSIYKNVPYSGTILHNRIQRCPTELIPCNSLEEFIRNESNVNENHDQNLAQNISDINSINTNASISNNISLGETTNQNLIQDTNVIKNSDIESSCKNYVGELYYINMNEFKINNINELIFETETFKKYKKEFVPDDWNLDEQKYGNFVKTELDYSDLESYNIDISSIKQDFDNSKLKICKVERIENIFLWLIYLFKSKEVEILNKTNKTYALLYHGTATSNINSICNENLNWRKVVNGRFGRGVSFATYPGYASNYCKGGILKQMIVTRVLTCKSCTGNRKTIIPPNGFDSTCDAKRKVFVKYDDHNFYPQFVVTFIAQK